VVALQNILRIERGAIVDFQLVLAPASRSRIPLEEKAVSPPGLSVFSSNSTRVPFLAATSAAISPHPPAPMTMISRFTFCMESPGNTPTFENFYYEVMLISRTPGKQPGPLPTDGDPGFGDR